MTNLTNKSLEELRALYAETAKTLEGEFIGILKEKVVELKARQAAPVEFCAMVLDLAELQWKKWDEEYEAEMEDLWEDQQGSGFSYWEAAMR